jgi:O-acetyl-ADP-ribose deacetylase (regulator of RNase III)
MIKIEQKSIFDSTAEAIVNPVNCKGTMGAGLAKEFRERFPKNFEAYKEACADKTLFPGRVFSFRENKKFIFNFPTKNDWRKPAELWFIELGLNALIVESLRSEIKTIALPPLGCGLGGLDFGKVSILISKAFAVVPQIDVVIFSKDNRQDETVLSET